MTKALIESTIHTYWTVSDSEHIYIFIRLLPSRLAQPARDALVFDLMCGAVDHGIIL